MPNNLWDLFNQPANYIPEPPPPILNPAPQGIHPAQIVKGNINALYEHYKNEAMNEMRKKGIKKLPEPSPQYVECRNQVDRLASSRALIRRELEELERALSVIATQEEVVREIGTQVRTHMSTLQTAASSLETLIESLLPPDSLGSATTQAASHSVPVEALQPAQVGQEPIGPGLWQQGQV